MPLLMETNQPTSPPNYLDLEDYIVNEKAIPKGNRYFLLKIDRKKYKWGRVSITGRELLELAGKIPVEKFQINQRFRFNRVEQVELDERVDLATCGVERFLTLPLDQTEGKPQRAFQLPEEDVSFLNVLENEWETVMEGGRQWLIIRGVNVPDGYSSGIVDVALMVAPGYPTSQIDMAYFSPPLSREDGQSIRALSNQQIEGKTYQRWSRHRTGQNPWRPGIDNISTHFLLVKNWLVREFK